METATAKLDQIFHYFQRAIVLEPRDETDGFCTSAVTSDGELVAGSVGKHYSRCEFFECGARQVKIPPLATTFIGRPIKHNFNVYETSPLEDVSRVSLRKEGQ